ncbi:30S ribosomal protein S12 methylthiotransferase RimO [Acetivibrio straminisolvens]|uniref:Ribosomal protein uS12 methylthiotransferase RimO n=1 Tax=Acetivibrio straminisolvens JCM 21531 TaxID=1294263 RepID=W4V727_9FIRM|nr:30S ribosomal protein S12 methylthiotransferase RimO [Acetivibrio straminisolvens]GAE89210.1 ribosomal protein S12p Asp88 methylthiotransferase [Acetivibrio straminisolvens JCM 21531]
MKKKVGIISLGCPKNLVDSEIMLGLLKKSDFEITSDSDKANIIIINTCGFIESAKEESINTILEMASYKNKNCEMLIVAGCLAQRYKDEIIKEIPEVDAVVGVSGYDEIAKVIDRFYSKNNKEKAVFHKDTLSVEYLNNERMLSTNGGYAYLKISEGCDNCCTYCAIPSIRGPHRSRKIEDIVLEARSLAEKGVKEVILVAQDVTVYGKDLYGQKKIVELLRQISSIQGIEWIRLLYSYPEEISEELIKEIAHNEKIVKYLDIPIQHISDKILKLMGRRSTGDGVRNILDKLRAEIPGIVIRTSLIVGFPGEDDKDFKALYDFVRKYEFDRLGVFTYSREEGTPAYDLKPQIKKSVKESRRSDIMQLQKEIVQRKNENRLDKVYKTLVEGVSEDGIFYYGRTYAEAPDIDGSVYFTSAEPLRFGEFVDVKILNVDDYDLIGEVINESSK